MLDDAEHCPEYNSNRGQNQFYSILWSYQTHLSIQGSESWLVSFDECQSLGRQGVIQSQHGNKFFSVSVSGVFHVSVTYVPVIIQGKPVRVSGCLVVITFRLSNVLKTHGKQYFRYQTSFLNEKSISSY